MDTFGRLFFSLGTTPKLVFLLSVIVLCLALAIIVPQWSGNGGSKEPPSLKGSIISNTYQYMTDMQGFLQRVA